MRTCDAAVAVLRETGNPAVMWGDEGLLHSIAERAQLHTRNRAWKTSDRVMANLRRNHTGLIAGRTLIRGHHAYIFWLPEHAPEWAKKAQHEQEEPKSSLGLDVAKKAMIAAGFATIGPEAVGDGDARSVLLIGTRLPRSECPEAVASVFAPRQSYLEFISYVYASPDGALDIETINASFNRRDDLKPDVVRTLTRMRHEHMEKLRAVFRKAKIAVRSIEPTATPLPCPSTFFMHGDFEDRFDGTTIKRGTHRCAKHRGHDDDHRAVIGEAKPGLFGTGNGLVWPNAGPFWTVKSLVPRRAKERR